jgi:hypothetical protein
MWMKRILLLLGALALIVALMATFVTESFVSAKAAFASAHPRAAFAEHHNKDKDKDDGWGHESHCPEKTQLLFSSTALAVSGSATVTPTPINVNCYGNISVLVHNTGTTTPVTLTLNITEGITTIPLDTATVSAGTTFSGTYQVPGRNLTIAASSTPGTTIDILAFGQ